MTPHHSFKGTKIMKETELQQIGRQVVETYIKALNTEDFELLETCLHFPHTRIFKYGNVQHWETAKAYLTEFKKRLQPDNWHSTRLLTIESDEVSSGKLHVSIKFERLRGDGSIIGNYFSLYIISYDNNYWGIRLGSGTG